MPIPSYQALKLPLLKFSADGKVHSFAEATQFLAKECKLSMLEEAELLSSSGQTIFSSRVSWANTYLKKAKILQSVKRGYFQITARGEAVLKQVQEEDLQELNNSFLEQFPEFVDFYKSKKENLINKVKLEEIIEDETYEDIIENAYQQVQQTLALELLEAIKKCSVDFFESLTLKLLLKMGYGNNIENTGQTTKKSHDHGIDGVIKEDKLGLGKVYIQAKKWIGTVGRPEIQKFAGALEGAKADKGVFITTSTFSKEAQNYVKEIGKKIALIDGVALADYMIEHDVGILPSVTYEIKRLDTKYFT